MNKKAVTLSSFVITLMFQFYLNKYHVNTEDADLTANKEINYSQNESNMKLGAFSMSLNVKDLQVSITFYEKLGFKIFGGAINKNYVIMKNGNALIGLFQGMFQGNILTFNPGWDENAKNLDQFDDVRKIQELLKGSGIKLLSEADTTTIGPASIMATDPDGNVILIDQHR